MEENKDVNLKTFNQAKLFAEQILFPLMFEYKKYLRQANYGCENLTEALSLSEEIRDIQRFNGLKAMAETCYDLLESISSTIRLKGNKNEITELTKFIETTKKLKMIFYQSRHKFFITIHKDFSTAESLNREYFEKIKEIIEICYVNTEILMTKNKLLFSDAKDDYASDEEIMEQIKKEYIEG